MQMYKCFVTLSFCLILVIFASASTAVASSLPPCSDAGFKHDCFGESRLGDGTVYKGEWKNNKFHGFGTFVFGAETQWAGHTFSGNFKDGTYHGYGIYTFPDGEKYVGDYKEGKKHGFGSYSFANGEKYIGAFADDQYNGQGNLTFANGDKYVGEFRDGLTHGRGTYIFADGEKYVGGFLDGKYHGQGVYNYANGMKDVGEFRDDQLNGFATRYLADGSIDKQGIWKDDKFLYASNGPASSDLPPCPASGLWHMCFAEFSEDDGSIYTGEWKDNDYEGFGTYIFGKNTDWADDVYVGDFKGGLFHGKGRYTKLNGENYVGGFREGKSSGYGIYTFANGDVYEGEYKDGKRHGKGTYTFPSGEKYEGEYKDGKKNGQGTYTFADGERYTGGFADDQYHGQGTYFYANGMKEVGEFKFGKLNGYAVRYFADGSVDKEGIWENDEFLYSQNDNNDAQPAQPVQGNNEIISASSGSGFSVSPDGHIITNNHVIEGCAEVHIHTNGKAYPASIVTFDPRNDLALLKADFTPEVVFPLSNRRPELLQDIYVAGYPFGMGISSSVKVTKGIISSLTGVGNNFSEMQIDAALQSGNSGGPILDEQGNVVGVAVAKLDLQYTMENFGSIPENTNFGIKSSVVGGILDSNGVSSPSANDSEMSKTDLGVMISKGTYYISCWMTMAQIEAMKSRKVMFSDLK